MQQQAPKANAAPPTPPIAVAITDPVHSLGVGAEVAWVMVGDKVGELVEIVGVTDGLIVGVVVGVLVVSTVGIEVGTEVGLVVLVIVPRNFYWFLY